MNTSKNRVTAWLSICLLAASAMTALAPTASAHSCKSYDESECDPNGCVEGQEHYHKHLRYWWEGDDEYCQTEGKEEEEPKNKEPKEKCIIADKEFPQGICDLINEGRAAFAPYLVGLPGLGGALPGPLPGGVDAPEEQGPHPSALQ